jgi:Ala-tRNA(Pro) deacylase
MTMANRLQNYLSQQHSHYDMLQHDPSMTAREAARRGAPACRRIWWPSR